MGKILTAEEFLIINDDKDFRLSMSGRYVSEMMIAFAKVHVEAALKEAIENAKISLGKDWIRKEEKIHPSQLVDSITIKVDKDSILNSYPLTNIK
jgi:hypothetical protein